MWEPHSVKNDFGLVVRVPYACTQVFFFQIYNYIKNQSVLFLQLCIITIELKLKSR